MVVLPHANGYEVTDNDFVCAWVQIVSRFGPPGADPYTVPIPRLSTRRPFAWYQDQEARCCTLEYLLRIIAPESYQGTAQATQPFINSNWIVTRAGSIRNASSGRLVEAVALSPNAPKCDAGLDDIESLFEADKGESDSSPTDVPQSTAGGARNPYSPQELHLVRCLVDQIHQDPFQPQYRQAAHGRKVVGWPERLLSYFWPNPRVNLTVTIQRLQPLLRMAQALAVKRGNWNSADRSAACQWATDVFRWGGVPQEPGRVNGQNIEAVFRAAHSGPTGFAVNALMNSGWTKIASFATTHLEAKGGLPQVIWDSRVATSVISRLDALCLTSGISQIPSGFSDLGRIAGRGGTRPRTLHLPWRNGYGQWSAQFAGTQVVREVRDVLNGNIAKYGPMPWPDSQSVAPSGVASSRWTMRGVEMVLFMDGY